ncbi:ZIP family zinc transporter [Arthrobacter ginkgonis]|uniref:ZIP family zinc transporter n=1 Tax=Arthrobacter ginkgonis TaxID=1630594 RepID=A0ABP7BQL2_9MICC
MPMWFQALAWGTFAGAALILGAVVAWRFNVPRKAVSSVMAFGAGVLISALAFELVYEANTVGGLWPTVAGFLVGALAYVGANALLVRFGAEHRRRGRAQHVRQQQPQHVPLPLGGPQPGQGAAPAPTEAAPASVPPPGPAQPSVKPPATAESGGVAIAVGALLDGIPESVVLGLGLVGGAAVNPTMLAAIFISNVPEGLASTADMKRAGKPRWLVFAVWGSIALLSGFASLLGYAALQNAPGELVAAVTAVAAGGILAMLADTMIPEAFEEQHMLTGLIAALGFLAAFILHQSA